MTRCIANEVNFVDISSDVEIKVYAFSAWPMVNFDRFLSSAEK